MSSQILPQFLSLCLLSVIIILFLFLNHYPCSFFFFFFFFLLLLLLLLLLYFLQVFLFSVNWWSSTRVTQTPTCLQVSRTLLSILADHNNAIIHEVSILSLTSYCFSSQFQLLGTVPSARTTIGIIITLMFHSFLSSLARSRYLSMFLLLFIFNVVRWTTTPSDSKKKRDPATRPRFEDLFVLLF